MIDSAIIIWALAPFRRFVVNSQYFPWNLPEKNNFFNNFFLRFCCYLSRCIPVERRGPPDETRRVLDKIQDLLSSQESIMIFPEGHRSRSGRIDTENYAYGVGRIVQGTPGTSVLCLYLRGKHQKTYSNLPRWGDTFYIDMEVIKPSSPDHGLRGSRDIASQIIGKLDEMEKKYFEFRKF
jgi:1-acyl-sn-glycerol-3-phosphate acyltransferase